MANYERIEGSNSFPANTNDVYGLIETLAVQEIKGLKSANRINDGFKEYNIENGKVIEEAVIEMAQAQAYDKDSTNFSPTDPVVHPKYFNNFESKQFKTTIRRDDIRTIIANKGVGVEDVVGEIIDSLTQGEGNYDFTECRKALYGASFVNYASKIGGAPKNMKGVLYALRDMYNHLRCNNDDLTAYQYTSATAEEDIRIAVSPKLMNLIDVKELASIFNLEKEQLFGKMVIVDVDDLSDHSYDNIAFVYDVKALGKATRILDFTQDVIGVGRFTNHYLTVERAYFHNGLFKGCFIDCTQAVSSEKATIIDTATTYTVTKTLSNVTTDSTVASVTIGDRYEAKFVAGAGYKLPDTIEVKIGNSVITNYGYDKSTGVVIVPHVNGGNLTVKITGVQA